VKWLLITLISGRKLNTSFGQNSDFLMKKDTIRHSSNTDVNIISFPKKLTKIIFASRKLSSG